MRLFFILGFLVLTNTSFAEPSCHDVCKIYLDNGPDRLGAVKESGFNFQTKVNSSQVTFAERRYSSNVKNKTTYCTCKFHYSTITKNTVTGSVMPGTKQQEYDSNSCVNGADGVKTAWDNCYSKNPAAEAGGGSGATPVVAKTPAPNIPEKKTVYVEGDLPPKKCPAPLEPVGSTCACPYYEDKSLGRPFGKFVGGKWICPSKPNEYEAAKTASTGLKSIPTGESPGPCPESDDVPEDTVSESLVENKDAPNYCQDFLNLAKFDVKNLREKAKEKSLQQCKGLAIDNVPSVEDALKNPQELEDFAKKLDDAGKVDMDQTMGKEQSKSFYYTKVTERCFKDGALANENVVQRSEAAVGDEKVVPKLGFSGFCKFDVACSEEPLKDKTKKYDECLGAFETAGKTAVPKIPGGLIPGVALPDTSGLEKTQKMINKLTKEQKQAYCKIYASVKSSKFTEDDNHFKFMDKPFHVGNPDFYKKLKQKMKEQCVKFAKDKKNEELLKTKCSENKGKSLDIKINQDELGDSFVCKDKIKLGDDEDSEIEMGYPVESCELTSVCNAAGKFDVSKVNDKNTKEAIKLHAHSADKNVKHTAPYIATGDGCMVEKYDYFQELMSGAEKSKCKSAFETFNYSEKAEATNSGKDCEYSCVCMNGPYYSETYKDKQGKNTSGHAHCVLK